jgi:endonuclease G, mitochondrial
MRNLLKSGLIAASFFIGSTAFAGFNQCSQFFANGTPPVAKQGLERQRELCFSNFAILHSGQSKTPIFVAEKINRASLEAATFQRTDRFYEEARLPSNERARLEDYRAYDTDNNRYDRGHMAPAADQNSEDAMAQSFSLANMVPQAPQNNRKVWAKIEKDTRAYAKRAGGDVYILSGPVFTEPLRKLGPGAVWIPNYLFKLVYDAKSGRAWAHWIENTDVARPSRPISYAELTRRTGIEFLPGLQPRD